jgi:hypothetical protein
VDIVHKWRNDCGLARIWPPFCRHLFQQCIRQLQLQLLLVDLLLLSRYTAYTTRAYPTHISISRLKDPVYHLLPPRLLLSHPLYLGIGYHHAIPCATCTSTKVSLHPTSSSLVASSHLLSQKVTAILLAEPQPSSCLQHMHVHVCQNGGHFSLHFRSASLFVPTCCVLISVT